MKFIEFFKKIGQFFKNLFRGVKVIDKEQWDKIVELSKNKSEKLFDLINNGKIIIASNKGYKLTQNKEEIGKYLKSRWGELTREMKTLKNMGYACNFTDEQIKLWEN